jgi:hypothetical protein
MEVLATVCDRGFGGRDFDDIIIEYLAESFQKKTGTYVHIYMNVCICIHICISKHIYICIDTHI